MNFARRLINVALIKRMFNYVVCCIYEVPKKSADDTSSSDSSDDSDAGNNYDRYPSHMRKAMRAKK